MMAPSKTRSHRKTPAPTLRDLFRRFAVPPSPIHEAIQEAARQEGWTAPWDREEQQKQKRAAGKESGAKRKVLSEMRVALGKVARARLTPEQRREPYAKASVDAFCTEYRNLFSEDGKDDGGSRRSRLDDLAPLILAALSKTDREKLRKVSRDTLIGESRHAD